MFAVSSWSKIWDEEGVTSLAVLPNGSAARVNVDSSPRCGVVFLFVPSPITSPSAAEAARGGERERRLRRDEGSTGRSRRVATDSQRSGRNARRAGPREPRFVHVGDLARQSRVMVFAWWNPCIIRPHCAADSGAGGELRGRASVAPFVLLCRAADVQRSGPGPTRPSHEAV